VIFAIRLTDTQKMNSKTNSFASYCHQLMLVAFFMSLTLGPYVLFLNLFLSIRRIFAQCPSTDESCISINMLKTTKKTLIHYRVPISAEGLSGRYWT
jgi:hypothetical protein